MLCSSLVIPFFPPPSIKFLVFLTFVTVGGYCLFSLPLAAFLRGLSTGRLVMPSSTTVSKRGAGWLLLLFGTVMGCYVALND